MIAEKMKSYVENSSVIRAMFEEGGKMAAVYGAENVYDFSLGNPNVAAPVEVRQAIEEIITGEDPVMVHGYMSNAGFEDVRTAVANSLNRRFDTAFHEENIIMTVGAAGGMNVIFRTILNPGDEVLTFAPYFGEYRAYVSNYDGILKAVEPDTDTFQPNLEKFEEMITGRTKAVIVNSPNNPTGVVYSEDTLIKLADILRRKQEELQTVIYLVTDEPYRELAYDGVAVPFVTKYYENTIVGYSFSKSLSLPGERIGYLVIPDQVSDSEQVIAAANVANRILGYVNAPSLFQRVIGKCIDAKIDVQFYDKNRRTLYDGLKKFGFSCIKPEGAFYLFVKSPVEDEKVFVEAAKKYHILIVPGSSFACPGYVRIAYCVSLDTIVNALPYFEKLAQEFFGRNV
ncbi:pyridoxal phosphate-dependent aminotransferase [Robinsoniella sp. KNHs210]|uniref:pyridoxal phosphate-dependent aminotransferase n=1 Tax=Robinsoniella sp. KNHs210 TaxID=1469950 RepID=UPI000489B309|nr:pyridoxal phosphate-dependent aminotransferase [Robinsoniella sp. KNHs210]